MTFTFPVLDYTVSEIVLHKFIECSIVVHGTGNLSIEYPFVQDIQENFTFKVNTMYIPYVVLKTEPNTYWTVNGGVVLNNILMLDETGKYEIEIFFE